MDALALEVARLLSRSATTKRSARVGAAAADGILLREPVGLKHLVEPMAALLTAVERQARSETCGAAVDAAIEQVIAERIAAIERGAHRGPRTS